VTGTARFGAYSITSSNEEWEEEEEEEAVEEKAGVVFGR
jgi:hypothetical protein